MKRSLPIALVVLGIAIAGAQAKSLKAKGNELFCQNRANFPEYLAVAHDTQFNYHTVAGCRQVAKGTRYQILEGNVETGMDKVRLFVWPRPTDGYLLVQGD
ncbi:MAG: hypothetical protein ACRECV_02495 [Xanthobacteraceae bacterium]